MLLRRSIFLASLTLATLSLAEDVAPLNPEPPPLSENDEVLVSTASKFDPDTTLLIESCLSVALIPVTLDERCEMTVPDYVSLQDNQTFPKSNPVVQKPSANTVQRGRGPHPIVFTSQGEAPCMTQIRPVESRPPTFEFLKAVPSQIMVPSSTTGNMVPVQLQYIIEDSCEAEEEMRCTLTLEKVLDRNDTEIFPSDQRKSEAPTKLRRKRSVEKQGGDIRGEVESRWWKVIDSHHVMISSRVPNVVGGSMKSEEGSTTALEKSGSLTYEIGVSCSFSSGVSVEKSVQVTVEEEESSKEAKEGEEGQRRVRKRRSMGEEL